MQFLWRYIDEFVGKGLDWTVIAEFLFYVSATLVPMALPLAILLASIMTFGNMGENYELTAMKAAGISLQRIMRPLLVLIFFTSLGAFYFSNNVMPVASLKTTSLLYDIRRQNPELILKEGIFTNDLEKFSVKVGRIDKNTSWLYDILIYDHREDRGNSDVIVADSGTMKTSSDKLFMILSLYSGNSYREVKTKRRRDRDNHPMQRIKFGKYETIIELPGADLKRTDENAFKSSYRMMKLSQLERQTDTLNRELDHSRKSFKSRLMSDTYFSLEGQFENKDSISQKKMMALKLNVDSLFDSSFIDDKIIAVDKALRNARTAKENIERKKREFTGSLKWMQKFANEWHRKFTLSFACLIFFFIGAPLGAIIRKGGLGLPVIISVVFFIIYYIISMTGERFSRELVMSSFMGMWISSIVILPLGIILTYKATTDSSILNIENYVKFYKKIKNLILSFLKPKSNPKD
jgi:lipopolysaccharide export system permease protein